MNGIMRRFASIPILAVVLCLATAPAPSRAQVGPCVSVAVGVPPPPLPAYTQPPSPASNYIWNPGYWAWGSYGYYWVAGTWVPPPAVGLYWTPGYWAFAGGGYYWNPGYWGPSVGFYGGINYGFGYFGIGFVGGAWFGNTLSYNTAVTNVNTNIVKNVYFNKTVINRSLITHSRVSFNGVHGGIKAKPTAAQRLAARDKRVGQTPVQIAHEHAAGENRNNLVAFNHAKPPVTTTHTPITSANRQPDFKPLSTHDQIAAQTEAINHMRVVGAPQAHGSMTAAPQSHSEHQGQLHGSVAGAPRHSPPQSRETHGNLAASQGFHAPPSQHGGPPRDGARGSVQAHQGHPGHRPPHHR